MELNELLAKVEYIYHLTSKENVDIIIRNRQIDSTVHLISNSELNNGEQQEVLRSRRVEHLYIKDRTGQEIMIRDQKPISIVSLNKCLTDGWSTGDFLHHLNNRVFFWPNLKRLNIHYNKYAGEEPLIIRCKMSDMLALNENVKLCRLNSGATRCHHRHGGAPPPRGANTFVDIEDFQFPAGKLAEVTFEGNCTLPDTIWIGSQPNGDWIEV